MTDDARTITALPGWLAILLVAGTSAAVLVLEILAGRLLAPYVGVSLDTYTGIIGTILAGIAVGAWAGGAAADRVDPRRLIPPLLVAGGALAIATIPIVRVIGSGSGSGGGVRIIILAAFGFLPAATVLSAVPPAVIKLQLRDLAATGSTVGQLSAWSTAGAIFGTFFTGFVLVANAAVSTLIVATGVILMLAGVAVWFPSRATTATSSTITSGTELLGVAGLGVMSIVGVVAIDSPCETQTSYYCLSVSSDDDREGGRTLVLDDLRHSYVDLDDPTHLEFWYVRRLVDAIETAPARDDIVYLGGGALTIPRYVRATAPDTRQTVLEIDGTLIDVVEDEMGFVPDPSIDVRIGDARLALRELADDSADIVIGDAFGSRSVPFHLATEEFHTDVDRVLRPGGVYAMNIIDSGGQRFLQANAATLTRVFDHVLVIRGEALADGRRGNAVIIASDTPLDASVFESRQIAAGDPGEIDTNVDVDGATLLTDDFAPVDQLIAAGS